jgi:carboxyl-terminal processing protease
LDAAVRIGSYFVPEGNILIERFKDGGEEIYKRQGRFLLGDKPLVVLVDGGSASASEIVAGAIQDAGTGTLIGDQTYGKGSVQLPNTMSDDSQLRVTIARWFTPDDREIHEKGLTPDIEVPFTEEDRQAERDPQLERAIEFLLTGE